MATRLESKHSARRPFGMAGAVHIGFALHSDSCLPGRLGKSESPLQLLGSKGIAHVIDAIIQIRPANVPRDAQEWFLLK